MSNKVVDLQELESNFSSVDKRGEFFDMGSGPESFLQNFYLDAETKLQALGDSPEFEAYLENLQEKSINLPEERTRSDKDKSGDGTS